MTFQNIFAFDLEAYTDENRNFIQYAAGYTDLQIYNHRLKKLQKDEKDVPFKENPNKTYKVVNYNE